jgi:hypothetical protein
MHRRRTTGGPSPFALFIELKEKKNEADRVLLSSFIIHASMYLLKVYIPSNSVIYVLVNISVVTT